jgi:hypothetical protein
MVCISGCVIQWFGCRLVSGYWLRDAGQMREAASYQRGHHCTNPSSEQIEAYAPGYASAKFPSLA